MPGGTRRLPGAWPGACMAARGVPHRHSSAPGSANKYTPHHTHTTAVQERGEALAPTVLGALRDKDPGCHAAMWSAVLSWLQAFPGLTAAAGPPKHTLNPLLSATRHAFYGSGAASFPAVLPCMALLAPPQARPKGVGKGGGACSVWV